VRLHLLLAAASFAFLPALSAASSPASGAEPAAPLVWDMPNEYPATSLSGDGDRFFAETLRAASNGRIEVRNHFDASFGGYRSKDMLNAVGSGAVAVGDAYAGALGDAEPIFLLSSLPFVAVTTEQSRLLAESARDAYERALARHHQRLLYVSPWPPSGLWAKRPVTGIAALKDLRIRVYDAGGLTAFKEAGALPVQISFADAIPQLRAGTLDAVLSSGDGGAGAKLWEILPHFTAINYAMPLSVISINEDAWQALAPDLKEAVGKAAATTEARQWREIVDRLAANGDRLRSNGVTVTTDLPPDFVQALRTAGNAAVDAWIAKAGNDGREALDRYRSRLR